MRLYSELAQWWPLLSPTSDYVEEAEDLLPRLLGATDGDARTLLELGSGGGSLAHQLKGQFELVLSDISQEMLDVSRSINPESEHVLGDMRSLNLGRSFDRVLIHDAVMYATDAAALRATIETAVRHCRKGGAVLLLPDCVRETFEADTETGGHDAPDGRGLRYVEWSWDPDPNDTTFETEYALLLRETNGDVDVEHERHRFGLFARAEWLGSMEASGLTATSSRDPWKRDVFVGVKR